MTTSRRSLLLLALELTLVLGFFVAFGVFVTQSEDFLVVRNNSRAAASAASRPPGPAEYSFGSQGADNALLGAGWHLVTESDPGAWSKGTAFVYVPAGAGSAALLRLDGVPYLAPGHETVTVTVSVDGEELGRWTARYGQPVPELVVSVPAAATDDGLLEVTIRADPKAVPYHFDRSDDKRVLGFMLRAVSLTPSTD